MKRWIAAALCAAMLMAAPSYGGDVYRWVDENGVVHYSDQPRDGAEKVELRQPQTFSVEESLPTTPTARDSAAQVPPGHVVAYESVRIVSPTSDGVEMNTAGEVAVQIEVNPPLNVAAGHRVVVFLDGSAVGGTPIAGTSIGLSGVYRGAHELRASVVDADGMQIIESAAITFHVRQTSIQNPQRRPRRR